MVKIGNILNIKMVLNKIMYIQNIENSIFLSIMIFGNKMILISEIKKFVEERIGKILIQNKNTSKSNQNLLKFNNILENIKRFENDPNRKN